MYGTTDGQKLICAICLVKEILSECFMGGVARRIWAVVTWTQMMKGAQ